MLPSPFQPFITHVTLCSDRGLASQRDRGKAWDQTGQRAGLHIHSHSHTCPRFTVCCAIVSIAVGRFFTAIWMCSWLTQRGGFGSSPNLLSPHLKPLWTEAALVLKWATRQLLKNLGCVSHYVFNIISSQVKAYRSGFTPSEPWTDNTLWIAFAEFPASLAQPAYFFLFLVLHHLVYFPFSVLLSGGTCLVWEEMNPQPTCPPHHSAQVRVGSIKSTWRIPPTQLKCWINLRSRICWVQPLYFGHQGKNWPLFCNQYFSL